MLNIVFKNAILEYDSNRYVFISYIYSLYLYFSFFIFSFLAMSHFIFIRSFSNVLYKLTKLCCLDSQWPGARFSKLPITFSDPKSSFMFAVFAIKLTISFNNLENDTIKVSVNEAELTGLWARNCATIQQVLISKFAFGPEKLPGLSRNGPLAFE